MLKRTATIINGFVHDAATGGWAATVLAVYWLHRTPASVELRGALDELKAQFFWIGLVCVVVVLVTGAGRSFTYAYVGEVYGPETERLRKRALIVKHIVLAVVFGCGTTWQYHLTYGGAP